MENYRALTDTMVKHAQLVQKLTKPGEDILASLTPEKCNLMHMAVGISGESGEIMEEVLKYISQLRAGFEYDKTNLVKELGDMQFYIVGERLALCWDKDPGNYVCVAPVFGIDGVSFSDIKNSPLELAGEVVVRAANILDLVKKHVIYADPVLQNEKIVSEIGKLEMGLRYLFNFFSVDWDVALEKNQEKLSKRYANGYSDAAAKARADEKPAEAVAQES